MTAIDLALVTGGGLTVGWLVFWLHRRSRVRARLARLTRPSIVTRRPPSQASVVLRAERSLLRRPRASVSAVAALGSGLALLASGPVAAVLVAVYVSMAVVALRRRLVRREAERLVAELLDTIDTTAEELRAGTIPDALGAAQRLAAGSARDRRVAQAVVGVARARLDAAYRLSTTLGVPLVDLLDRVDADLRSGQALRGGVAAQLAGAQATSTVLLALPVAGLWVGAALGTDPLYHLLHTTLGAACAVLAAALQCAGHLWTSRMAHAVTSEVH